MGKRRLLAVAATNALVACVGLAGAGLAASVLPGTGPARISLADAGPAAYMGSQGRIAFVRNGDIYSIKPSGSGLRLLAGGGHDAGPRWSPNGSKLAYLDGGNLWIMNADGSHKHQIGFDAPFHTEGRPSWSPSGQYLAFVRSARHASQGLLTRYDTVTGHFRTFTASFDGGTVAVPALAGTAVAWNLGLDNTSSGYFIMYEGAGALCSAHHFCLNALGFGRQSQFRNGFPSAEEITPAPKRLIDPDWYPLHPQFDTDVLTTVEHCTSGGCSHTGIQLRILGPVILPGGYQAVYSPTGGHIAFVRNGRHGPAIFLAVPSKEGTAMKVRRLTAGTEPDWQPTAPFPPA